MKLEVFSIKLLYSAPFWNEKDGVERQKVYINQNKDVFIFFLQIFFILFPGLIFVQFNQ